jgi:transposase-like protein
MLGYCWLKNSYPSSGDQQHAMLIRDVCPRCKSSKYKKNEHIHNGKHNHYCHDCSRQFVQCFAQYLISEDKQALIERLLLERISLRSIGRAVGVSLKWLLGFLVQCVEALPEHLHVQSVIYHDNVMVRRVEAEADEVSSFVQKKAHKQWLWSATDATSRQIIAFHVGDRSRRSAKRLWVKIPQVDRQHATLQTPP